MRVALTQLNLSARAYQCTRSVKLTHTIADLAGSEEIQTAHLADALQYCLKSVAALAGSGPCRIAVSLAVPGI